MKRLAFVLCVVATLPAQRSSQPAQGERIAVLEEKVTSLNQRLDKLDAKLDEVNHSLTAVQVELGKVNTQLLYISSIGGTVLVALLGGVVTLLIENFKKKDALT